MKHVLVTGATSGIGKDILESLKESKQYEPIGLGRKIESLDGFKTIKADLSTPAASSQISEGLRDHLGGDSLYAIIHCAGVFLRKPFLETTDEDWDQQFQTNVMGTIRATRVALGHMQEGARIITVGSTLGLRPVAQTAAYSASKAAIDNLTRCLALELADQKITVNCIHPGIVETPIHGGSHTFADDMAAAQPLGRVGQPSDIFSSIEYFLAPGSAWTTGSVLNVDGGINL